eukprot:2245280-Lingulodinium_polyedra.AAC.1
MVGVRFGTSARARVVGSVSGAGLRVASRTSQTHGRLVAGISSGGERAGHRFRASGSPPANILVRLACGAMAH